MGTRPRTGPEWMRWVEGRLRRHEARLDRKIAVPIGAMILWPTGSGSAPPPAKWVAATGGTFAYDDYPDLGDQLAVAPGGTGTLPNPTAPTGGKWYVRVE